MSIGSAIVVSTLIVVLALCIRQIGVNGKWRLVGRVIVICTGLCLLLIAGMWSWSRYRARPVEVSALGGIELGMRPVDVKLALGAPWRDDSTTPDLEDNEATLAWLYTNPNSERILIVHFLGPTVDSLGVSIICERRGSERVLGLGQFSSEADVIAKLGEPSKTSISHDGLSKMVSYNRWNVAFGLQRALVDEVCVMSTASVVFREEYSGIR